jgi:hypothetical protein
VAFNSQINQEIFSNFYEGNVKAQTMWAIEGDLWDINHNYNKYWATAGYAEGIAKSISTFLSDLKSLPPATAATTLAQNINSLNNLTYNSTMKSLLNADKTDPQIGQSVSAFLDAYNATISALAGTATIADAKRAINETKNAIKEFTNSSERNETDYNNSINAIQTAFNYMEQNWNSGDKAGNNNTYTEGHSSIKAVYRGALNGTQYTSDGAQIANLTVALGSLEEAISLYQKATTSQ